MKKVILKVKNNLNLYKPLGVYNCLQHVIQNNHKKKHPSTHLHAAQEIKINHLCTIINCMKSSLYQTCCSGVQDEKHEKIVMSHI